LIDGNKSKILLNQEFVDKGILVLKYDGFSDKYFLLANENIIPDLNIEGYLRRIFYNLYNIALVESSDNLNYEILRETINDDTGAIGQTVLKNAKIIREGMFQSKHSKVNYYIKNSKIYNKSIILFIKTLDGHQLFIESFFILNRDKKPKRGDIVRLNNSDFAPDGIYKIGMFKKIKVKNGVIV